MEVHHHGHVHQQRKWKEYLFQFLMLFLAVFCGFFAEYLLEHKIEKEREKGFIRSFTEDLTADERDLQLLIESLDSKAKMADTLSNLLANINPGTPANRIYMFIRDINRSQPYASYINDRTIVQLRNAAGMRLIHNKQVSDSIVAYYKEFEMIQFLNEENISMKRSLREKSHLILDGVSFGKIIDSSNKIINPSEPIYLRRIDPDAINSCLLDINGIMGISRGLKKRIERFRQRASRVKEFIRNEYHLK